MLSGRAYLILYMKLFVTGKKFWAFEVQENNVSIWIQLSVIDWSFIFLKLLVNWKCIREDIASSVHLCKRTSKKLCVNSVKLFSQEYLTYFLEVKDVKGPKTCLYRPKKMDKCMLKEMQI